MPKTKQLILIVEDEALLNEAYQGVLEHDGFTTIAAYNGEEALNLLKNHNPDLILLDLRMPKMDGLGFLRRLSETSKDKNFKIVIFSNYDVQKDIDEAFKLGATHYVLKAFASPKELTKIVKDTLAGK